LRRGCAIGNIHPKVRNVNCHGLRRRGASSGTVFSGTNELTPVLLTWRNPMTRTTPLLKEVFSRARVRIRLSPKAEVTSRFSLSRFSLIVVAVVVSL
jgi:hypothetical protein